MVQLIGASPKHSSGTYWNSTAGPIGRPQVTRHTQHRISLAVHVQDFAFFDDHSWIGFPVYLSIASLFITLP